RTVRADHAQGLAPGGHARQRPARRPRRWSPRRCGCGGPVAAGHRLGCSGPGARVLAARCAGARQRVAARVRCRWPAGPPAPGRLGARVRRMGQVRCRRPVAAGADHCRARQRPGEAGGGRVGGAVSPEVAWSEWPAPAKLNLFLQIPGRRADGYHLLQTVFRLLEWGDTLRLRPRADGRIVRHGDLAPGTGAEDDLAVRAARLLAEEANASQGADIFVEKRIPAGAGFGGGSSDASTALVALDAIWGTDLGVDRLAAL